MDASPKVGAFFDIDGTLLDSPSLEWRFTGYLLAHDEIGNENVARWLAGFAKNLLRDPRAATLDNKRHLAGLRESTVDDWANSLAENPPEFFADGIERVAWHVAQGHRVILLSGTLAPLALAVTRYLPGPLEVCATALEVCDGCLTGRLAGERMSGRAKARALRRIAARWGLSLWNSYAYGNALTDLPMLDAVGRRVAVNPSGRMRRIALDEGWQSCDWTGLATAASASRAARLAPKEAR
jgi:HAD superfamily hydrolase (TIGR01490 family)